MTRLRRFPLRYAAALAAVGIGAWSLHVLAVSAPAATGELAAPGGVVRVESVHPAPPASHRMLDGAGVDVEPVPAGERRLIVTVTLTADENRSLTYSTDRFVLTPDGGAERTPHRAALPGTSVPPGERTSGMLVFDVPVEASGGELKFTGGGTARLTFPAGNEHHHEEPRLTGSGI